METFKPIMIGLLLLSFVVPSYVRMNYLRTKGYNRLAYALECAVMIVAILCQWSWYFFFFYVLWYVFNKF